MSGAFALFSLRPLARKKVRVALSAASVAVGVAAFVATAGTNRAVLAAFREGADAAAGRTDLEVGSATRSVPRDLAARVRGIEGVAAALPVAEFSVSVTNPERAGRVLVVGVEPGDAAARTYRGVSSVSSLNPLLLLAGDGSLVTRTLAEEGGLPLGARFEVSSAAGRRSLRVAGILELEGIARAFGARVVVLPLDLACSLLGTPERCTRVDLVLAPGADRDAVAARVAAAVGERFTVSPPSRGTNEIDAILGTLRVVISITSLIALGVAVFLVYNSAALAAVERAREFGLLRALGSTRRRVVALFVGESALVGLLGAVPGVALGALLADAAARLFVQTAVAVYFFAPGVRAEVSAVEALLGVLAGVAASALAGLVPALGVAKIAPVQTLREEIRADPIRMRQPLRVGLAGLLFAAAAAFHVLGERRAPHAGWIVLACLAVGGLVGVWPLARLVVAPFAAALARASPVAGRFAADGFRRSPGRIGFTVAAIAAGFALALHTSIVVASYRVAVDDWMRRTLGGDFWVFQGGFKGSSLEFDPFGPELLDEVTKIPGVARADAARVRVLPYRGGTTLLTAYDPLGHAQRGDFIYREGDEATTQRELPGRRAVLVSEGFAHFHRVGRGGVVRLETARGAVDYAVSGIVVDYGWPRGVLLMDRAVYREDFEDPFLDDCVIVLAEGADPAAVRRAVFDRLGGRYELAVLSLDEFCAEARKTLDRFFGFTRAQTAVTILLAFLGVVNAAWIGTLVRSRELGLLRAVGAPSRAVGRLVVHEAALVGIVGGVLGAVLGIALGIEVVSNLSIEFSGFGVPLVLPPRPVLAVLAGAFAASIAAALVPARRASRMPVLEAIAYE